MKSQRRAAGHTALSRGTLNTPTWAASTQTLASIHRCQEPREPSRAEPPLCRRGFVLRVRPGEGGKKAGLISVCATQHSLVVAPACLPAWGDGAELSGASLGRVPNRRKQERTSLVSMYSPRLASIFGTRRWAGRDVSGVWKHAGRPSSSSPRLAADRCGGAVRRIYGREKSGNVRKPLSFSVALFSGSSS